MVNLYRRNNLLDKLPKTAIDKEDINILLSAKDYLNQLLQLIDNATTRIYLTVLYLEDDEVGRVVVDHLIKAKQRHPELDIKVFVDFHRARRGLYGQDDSDGNAGYYQQIDREYPNFIQFYGVAVKHREVFGVLHLKGMIFDDVMLYTGASINNIYLHYQEKYRYDRYSVIKSAALADSFSDFLLNRLITSPCVYLFNQHKVELSKGFKREVTKQRKQLSRTHYEIDNKEGDLLVTPLIGLGKRGNQLNTVIEQQILTTEHKLVLYTPYFNLPGSLRKAVTKLLRNNKHVEIVIGDKRASDFFIPEDQPFRKIGLIPYLYEGGLRQFVKKYQKFINNGQLTIRLWQHQGNSFHLKGVRIDSRYHLLTGNNLNPRAWRLDIENGLLIEDKLSQLAEMFDQEHQEIITHTRIISHWQQIDSESDYPKTVKLWLKRLHRTKLDKLFQQYM